MKNHGFEFYQNYIDKVMRLQGEVYSGIKRIINERLHVFSLENKRKALVLDVGSGGLIPYDHSLAEKITLMDLFPRSSDIILPKNAEWIVDDILLYRDKNTKYDIIILANMIHHLADKNNNIIQNMKICFNNCARLVDEKGLIYIFDGTCPAILTRLQDILYPFYSFIFLKILKFTYTRIPSLNEIIYCLHQERLSAKCEFFKQPKWIGQIYWKVPLKIYPMKYACIRASLK